MPPLTVHVIYNPAYTYKFHLKTRDIPENTIYVLLGGYLYDNEQKKILIEHNMEIARLNNWANDNPEFEKQWMYR